VEEGILVAVQPGEIPVSDSGLFVRKATGLVRSAGMTDTIFYNWVAGGAVGLALVYNVYWALNAFPGVNLTIATLLVVPFAVCAVLVFGLLASAMPRSGGDYVFVSRIVHPVWGFLSSWTGFISVVAYSAWVAWFTAVAFVPATLGVLAKSTGNTMFLNWSTWASGKTGAYVIGGAILIISGLVMAAGIRVALRVITVLAVIGLIGLLLSAIVFLTHSHADFVAALNKFAPGVGKGNAYNDIIRVAGKNGLPAVGSGSAPFASSTLPAMVITFYAIGYSVWSIYFAGEFRGARERSRQLRSMMVPTVLNTVVFIALYALMFSAVGYQFANASSYLYNYVPAAYPLAVPPFVPFFASLLSGSTVLNVIIAVSWLAWPIAMTFLIMVGFSRLIFAWSFDEVVPSALSKVNARTHAPVRAIVTSVVLSFVGLVLLLQVKNYLTFIAYTVLLALVFWFSMALAGVLFPYRMRDVYRSGPARWEIAGIPVITIVGSILLAFVVFEFVMVFKYSGLGIVNRGQAILITLAVIAAGAVIFATSYLVKRARGRDLMVVFREIPPE
jgi:APA family basic amino acid/polyamine antiporter